MRFYWLLSLIFAGCVSPKSEIEITPETAIVAQAEPVSNHKIYVEFLVYPEQIERYPILLEVLNRALAEWATYVPITYNVRTENSLIAYERRPGIIKVLFEDIQNPGTGLYHYPGILGIWLSHKDTLMVDADYLEFHPEKAYSVLLHEIGHLLGVPHIVNTDDMAFSGMIVTGPETDARDLVMYPVALINRSQDKLSLIEINIARHYVLHNFINRMFECGVLLVHEDTHTSPDR